MGARTVVCDARVCKKSERRTRDTRWCARGGNPRARRRDGTNAEAAAAAAEKE